MSEPETSRLTRAAAYRPDVIDAAVAPPATERAPSAAAERAPGAAVLGGLDVPRDTTPTFELEMLVSGAALFGLLQLPSAIHEVTGRWEPHVGVPGLFSVAIANLLLVGAVYALATCFVMHLVLRGYWVAMVGVHSVYPAGPRWERLKEYGPVQGELSRQQSRPLPEHIARVDNVASLVFATGFVMAVSTLSSVVWLAAVMLPAWAAEQAFGVKGVLWTLGGVLAPLCLVLVAAQVMDQRMKGTTPDPASARVRYIRAVMRPLMRLTPAGIKSLSAVLTTNISKRVVITAFAVGFAGAMGGAWLSADTDADLPGAGNYRFFVDYSDRSVPAVQYASLRGDAAASLRLPSLDADVVTGPYARLFIPYRALRHNAALAAACQGLQPADVGDDDSPERLAAADAVLRCAERMHRVALDGAAVPGLRFHFFADPRTNRRGFLAYVPTAALAPGEHQITVWPSKLPGDPPPKHPYALPFWK